MSSFALAFVLLPAWAYLLGTVVAAARFARRRAEVAAAQPPVAVLKPLYGDEPGLYDNLRSFVEQDYPALQMVMGVRNPSDGALPAARAVIADFPDREIDLVVDPSARGSNLKVANLENMLPAARHDVLVLADSDIRVGRDYAAVVTAPLDDPAVGYVTCLYRGVSTGGLWSRLGALYINYGFLPSALVGDALGAGDGCFGATIALRRDVLDRIGGFARLRDELADDHRIGAAVRELGLKGVLSSYLVETRVAEPDFRSLWRHELRWARTVRAMAPAGFAGSILTHGVAIAFFVALATGLRLTGWAVVLLSCVLRWATAGVVARLLRLPGEGLWLLPLRDALSFAVFIASFWGRSVAWRDRSFRVDPEGRMSAEGDRQG
jgi:ceramide glucosyltransferase